MPENAQTPQRRVHALLGGTLLTELTPSRDYAWTRGSKLCGQHGMAKTLANSMTRALANDHNPFVQNDATCPTLHVQTSKTRQIKNALQPKTKMVVPP